jgi:hypothetical protein
LTRLNPADVSTIFVRFAPGLPAGNQKHGGRRLRGWRNRRVFKKQFSGANDFGLDTIFPEWEHFACIGRLPSSVRFAGTHREYDRVKIPAQRAGLWAVASKGGPCCSHALSTPSEMRMSPRLCGEQLNANPGFLSPCGRTDPC